MTKQVDISIIIVNYKVEKELLECIESIKNSRPHLSYEVIVVDNDEVKTIEKNLTKKYSDVIYIANPKNTGWGAGINLGVEKARGEYLYFLNPDTVLLTSTLDLSYQFYKSHPQTGIVGSLLYDRQKTPYPIQGSEELTPFKALFALSVVNKKFPNNPVSRSFYNRNVTGDKPIELEITTLTAAMIKADVFKKAGMFDPQLFLYCEEFDLGKRVRKLGYHNYILTSAKVLHYWESSTKQRNDRNEILEKSRYHYFQKHFGTFQARLVEAFLRRDLRMLVVE